MENRVGVFLHIWVWQVPPILSKSHLPYELRASAFKLLFSRALVLDFSILPPPPHPSLLPKGLFPKIQIQPVAAFFLK